MPRSGRPKRFMSSLPCDACHARAPLSGGRGSVVQCSCRLAAAAALTLVLPSTRVQVRLAATTALAIVEALAGVLGRRARVVVRGDAVVNGLWRCCVCHWGCRRFGIGRSRRSVGLPAAGRRARQDARHRSSQKAIGHIHFRFTFSLSRARVRRVGRRIATSEAGLSTTSRTRYEPAHAARRLRRSVSAPSSVRDTLPKSGDVARAVEKAARATGMMQSSTRSPLSDTGPRGSGVAPSRCPCPLALRDVARFFPATGHGLSPTAPTCQTHAARPLQPARPRQSNKTSTRRPPTRALVAPPPPAGAG